MVDKMGNELIDLRIMSYKILRTYTCKSSVISVCMLEETFIIGKEYFLLWHHSTSVPAETILVLDLMKERAVNVLFNKMIKTLDYTTIEKIKKWKQH